MKSSNFIDLTGKRFGKLTVIELADPTPTKSGYKRMTWRCRCDCGRERDIRAAYLLRGQISHCGKCEPLSWRGKLNTVCRYCEWSTWDDEKGEWNCAKGASVKGEEECKSFWCASHDKITGVQNRSAPCVICGRPVYSRGVDVPIYCYEHRSHAAEDEKCLEDIPNEILFSLIASIFLRAREDYMFNTDGQRSDAERFFRSEWAQALSLSAFDAEKVLAALEEEMEDELNKREKHNCPTM